MGEVYCFEYNAASIANYLCTGARKRLNSVTCKQHFHHECNSQDEKVDQSSSNEQ